MFLDAGSLVHAYCNLYYFSLDFVYCFVSFSHLMAENSVFCTDRDIDLKDILFL